MKSYAKIEQGERLTLGDIAELKGLHAEDEKALAQIDLGKAPALGDQRVLSSEFVSKALRRQAELLERLNLRPNIPNQIVVENRGFELDPAKIEKQLKEQWAELCNDCQFKVKNLSLPALPLALKGKSWSLVAPTQLPRGSFSSQLQVATDHGRPAIFWVTGVLQVMREVPVLTHAVTAGHRLQKEDIKMEWKDTTFSYDAAPTKEELVGQLVKLSLRAGDILWKQNLQRDLALRRGDFVRVVSGSDVFEVSLTGVAEQDGFIGDTVKVRNKESGKIIAGRVSGRGEVKIE